MQGESEWDLTKWCLFEHPCKFEVAVGCNHLKELV
jgi:hypothetical protein